MLTDFIAGSTGTLDTIKGYKSTKIIAYKVMGNTTNFTIKWTDVKMSREEYGHIGKGDMKAHNQEKLDEYWESCGGRERAASAREICDH
jgi:hypothetical protein